MTLANHHRPAVQWLNDLQKAKVDGMTGLRPKITITDLLEKVNDPTAPEQALIPSSPRSVESCFRLGIDPVELQYHPIDYYKYTGDTDEIARIRYEKCEAVRQERVKSLTELRKRLVDDGWNGEPMRPGSLSAGPGGRKPGGKGQPEGNSSMVEKERQRLEVMKKRQERDLQQMLMYEQQRKELVDKQQAKVDAMEARSRELLRQKEENEREWTAKQRELELAKHREEQALEREAARIAEEQFKRERELQKKREEEERRLKKEAYLKEMERRQKTDEARMETERILAEQAERVRQRRMLMDQSDAERAKRLAAEAKELAARNVEKRKAADARIQSALTMNGEIMRKKREDFERKEAEAARRKAEAMERERKEFERKRLEELRREKERQDKYLASVAQEEARKKSIKDRAEAKERELAAAAAARARENNIRKVEKELDLKMRLDRVDEITKIGTYQRQSLLERIMDEYERTRGLMRERQGLQEARKNANMTASLQRHKVSQAMDQLKNTKNLGSLGGPGGSVNINDILSRRPATAH